jgi:hypothetical protein
MHKLPIATIAALTLLAASPVGAQDIAGSWEIAYTMETPRGSMERTMVVHLEQDGAALTGTAEMAALGRGGGGGGTRTVELSDGMIEDGAFSFRITMGGGQRSFAFTFRGTVSGDAMEGTVETLRGGGTPFTGKRAEG